MESGPTISDEPIASLVISECGMVSINEYRSPSQTAFTGWKSSGIGLEQSKEALRFYTKVKNVNVKALITSEAPIQLTCDDDALHLTRPFVDLVDLRRPHASCDEGTPRSTHTLRTPAQRRS